MKLGAWIIWKWKSVQLMRLCKRTVTIPKPLYGEVKEYIYRRLDQPQLDQQVPLGIFFHHGFFVQKKDVFFYDYLLTIENLKGKRVPSASQSYGYSVF